MYVGLMTLFHLVQRLSRASNGTLLPGAALLRFGLGLGAVTLGYLGLQLVIGTGHSPPDRVMIATLQPAPAARSRSEPPQVWLLPQFNPGALPPFARDDFVEVPVLPRRQRPLPPLPPRAAAAAAPVPTAGAVPDTISPGPVSPASGPTTLTANQEAIAPGTAPGTALGAELGAELVTGTGTGTGTGAGTGTPTAALDAALADDRAPLRSRRPRARPVITAALATPADAAGAPPAAVRLALARSPLPPRRPAPAMTPATAPADVVLASVAAAIPDSAPRAPRTRSPLEVPPLSRAIARADRCESSLTRAIPRRARNADGGATAIGRLTSLRGRARDNAVLDEVLRGNIPEYQRNLVPVTFTGTATNGQETRITICVMPDYLAVGSDRDFVRVPLGLPAAARVAEQFDMILPTTRMVDAIYAQAGVRLSPAPMQPGAQMESTDYFLRHNATVESQFRQAGGQLGQLVSGQKKDLVLTNRLDRNPGRVAIYGWHRRSGSPIQPLSTVHGAQYADYSHGVRLVSRRAYVNGRAIDLSDLLSDSRLAGLVSSEGTISNRRMLAALR